ncbi:MAG: SDR family oxidoreductase [Fimbriimonas sp.]
MDVSNATVLVTGGSTGIGFALARRFAESGARVIVCGRRVEALHEAKAAVPSLITIRCDVAKETDRIALFDNVTRDYPELNVLVNNAGIQNRPPKFTEAQDWPSLKNELAINFEAPVHLASLFVPFLAKRANPALINVTSGLAFVPLAFMPTYCATKAALHSFTLSLRRQLADTPVRVVEIAPPAVNTDLGGKGLHDFGVPLDEFADDAFRRLLAGELEFGYGTAEGARLAGRAEIDAIFERMNAHRPPDAR